MFKDKGCDQRRGPCKDVYKMPSLDRQVNPRAGRSGSESFAPWVSSQFSKAGSIGFLQAASLLGQSLSHKQAPAPSSAVSACTGHSAWDKDRGLPAAMSCKGAGLLWVQWALSLLLLLGMGECVPPLCTLGFLCQGLAKGKRVPQCPL